MYLMLIKILLLGILVCHSVTVSCLTSRFDLRKPKMKPSTRKNWFKFARFCCSYTPFFFLYPFQHVNSYLWFGGCFKSQWQCHGRNVFKPAGCWNSLLLIGHFVWQQVSGLLWCCCTIYNFSSSWISLVMILLWFEHPIPLLSSTWRARGQHSPTCAGLAYRQWL